MLVIDGTPGDDTVVVTTGRRGEVSVNLNGLTSGPFRPTGRVVVLGYGGADRVQVAGTVAVPTWLAGGTGNDTLIAGGGPAVLLGGPGNHLRYLISLRREPGERQPHLSPASSRRTREAVELNTPSITRRGVGG
jgi:hypothetical protein